MRFVLLGAGASVEAGIPSSAMLSKSLVEKARRDQPDRQASLVLEYVYSSLAHQRMRMRVEESVGPLANIFSPLNEFSADVDIELLLRAIDQLARRNTLEILPFVGSWDPTLHLLDNSGALETRVRELMSEVQDVVERAFQQKGSDPWGGNGRRRLESDISNAVGSQSRNSSEQQVNPRDLAQAINEFVSDEITSSAAEHASSFRRSPGRVSELLTDAIRYGARPGEGQGFLRARKFLEELLARTLWLEVSSSASYLTPMVVWMSRVGGAIATLNYDNCIELACTSASVSCSVGTGEIDGSDEGTHVKLLKLHGSLNWRKEIGEGTRVEIVSDAKVRAGDVDPLVIFGQQSKLSAAYPFFDLFLQFRDTLEVSQELVVIGYSWRDEHVNSVVSRWFDTDFERRIIVVDPYISSNFDRPRFLADRTRVSVVEKGAAEAIKDIFV